MNKICYAAIALIGTEHTSGFNSACLLSKMGGRIQVLRGATTTKKNAIVAGAALALMIAGCTSTPTFQQGADAEVTFDGLTRVEGTVMDDVWARADIDLKGYTKVMFEGVGVEYRPVTGPYSGRAGTTSVRRSSDNEFQLDAETRALFEKEIQGAFLDGMGRSKVFTIVDEPGPDVLLVQGGLLDVVSRVPPETVGRSRIFIDSVGEATLVLEIRDSESNAIFARAIDRRAAEDPGRMTESNRVTNLADVRRLGRRWATVLREALEKLLTEGV